MIRVLQDSVAVVGVDLSAGQLRTSAAAIVRGSSRGWVIEAPHGPLESDDDIVRFAARFNHVGLDGPRFPPPGFLRFISRGQQPPPGSVRSRLAEREHLRRICPIFFSSPVATLGIQRWMRRSWSLFAALGQRPIEVYPMGSFVALKNGVNRRKPHDLAVKTSRTGQHQRIAMLRTLLGKSIDSFVEEHQGNERRHDRLDAAMAAVTVAYHVTGQYTAIGDPVEGEIIVPNDPDTEWYKP